MQCYVVPSVVAQKDPLVLLLHRLARKLESQKGNHHYHRQKL